MNLNRVATLAYKEWRETTRDRMFLSLAFLLPVLWMVVFGYGLVLDVEDIPFASVDRDRTTLSRDYLYRFMESRYFSYQGALSNEKDADALLETGKVRAVIIVPDKFEERLLAGTPANVQILIDGTFPMRTDITKGYVIAINNDFSEELIIDFLMRTRGLTRQQASVLIKPITLEVRYLYNQEVKSIWGLGPALVMFSLIFSTPMLTALGIVREKERGSIYNIFSSTVTRLEFLIGKLSPFIFIATINAMILWTLTTYLFEVPFKGNFLFFAAASLIFVVCCAAIGLLVSLLVNTQMAALIITIVLTTVPTFLFSGFITPVSSLSPGAQVQAHFFPAMYYTDIVRGAFLKGAGFEELASKLLALALYTVVLLVCGYSLFHKRPKA
jgi:drug efflux transport system permease protein